MSDLLVGPSWGDPVFVSQPEPRHYPDDKVVETLTDDQLFETGWLDHMETEDYEHSRHEIYILHKHGSCLTAIAATATWAHLCNAFREHPCIARWPAGAAGSEASLQRWSLVKPSDKSSEFSWLNSLNPTIPIIQTTGALYIPGHGERDLLLRYAPAPPIIVLNLR